MHRMFGGCALNEPTIWVMPSRSCSHHMDQPTYIYIYVCVYMYAYIYPYIHTHTYVFIYTSIHMRKHVSVCIYTCIRVHIYVYITYVYIYVYACAYISIYLSIYLSIYRLGLLWPNQALGIPPRPRVVTAWASLMGFTSSRSDQKALSLGGGCFSWKAPKVQQRDVLWAPRFPLKGSFKGEMRPHKEPLVWPRSPA